MAKTIGRNTNTNDTATVSAAIALNISTSVKIADANPNRVSFTAAIISNQDVFVKLQPASEDDIAKGIPVSRNCPYKMDTDNVYTGEISAIASVDTPNIYVTEY